MDPHDDPPRPETIPRLLHSEYEERPFKSCTRCGESLVDFEEGFRVSKVYNRGECIFEYALCGPCFVGMMDEASEESKQKLAEFHNEHFRDISSLDECGLCENTRDGATEFGLVGICHGEGLHHSNMICEDCMMKQAELVSKQTRDVWDKFKDENFPGVPTDWEPMPISDGPQRTPDNSPIVTN